MHDLLPIMIALFIVASLLKIDFFFSVVYILAGVYILGRLWAGQAIRQLIAERTLVNRAFPGESIPVTLWIRNTGWLPVQWVELHDSLPVEMSNPPFFRQAISLKGHEEHRFEYTLQASKRGYYTIGPLIWRTGDLLGLSPQYDKQQQSEYIIVYPTVLPLAKLGLPTRSPLAQLASPEPLFEDPTRITGLRDYQIGDSPRRLHWSASASAGKLLVKRYQPAIARETIICLDMNQGNFNRRQFVTAVELAVTTTASLASHIISRDHLAVGLSTQFFDPLEQELQAIHMPPRKDRTQLMGILEILARAQRYAPEIPADSLQSFKDFVRETSTTLSWGATLMVITGNIKAELYDELVQLRQRGFAIALILVMPEASDSGFEPAQHRRRLPVYQVWREADMEVLA